MGVMDEDDAPRGVPEHTSQEEATTSPSGPGRLRKPIVVVGILIVAAVGVALLTLRSDPTYTISGRFELVTGWNFNPLGSDSCAGTGGYSDIRPGAQVTVRGGSGSTLAISRLGESKGALSPATCSFEFSVTEVPREDFYRIEVSHRGEIEFSFAEMESKNWMVELTLGS